MLRVDCTPHTYIGACMSMPPHTVYTSVVQQPILVVPSLLKAIIISILFSRPESGYLISRKFKSPEIESFAGKGGTIQLKAFSLPRSMLAVAAL